MICVFLPSCNCLAVYFAFTNPCLRSLAVIPVAPLQFFSSIKRPDEICDPPSSNTTGTDCSLPGTNWPEHEAVYSSPSSAVRPAIWRSNDLISYFCLYMYVLSLLSRHVTSRHVTSPQASILLQGFPFIPSIVCVGSIS
jgi:hypothetical protein